MLASCSSGTRVTLGRPFLSTSLTHPAVSDLPQEETRRHSPPSCIYSAKRPPRYQPATCAVARNATQNISHPQLYFPRPPFNVSPMQVFTPPHPSCRTFSCSLSPFPIKLIGPTGARCFFSPFFLVALFILLGLVFNPAFPDVSRIPSSLSDSRYLLGSFSLHSLVSSPRFSLAYHFVIVV